MLKLQKPYVLGVQKCHALIMKEQRCIQEPSIKIYLRILQVICIARTLFSTLSEEGHMENSPKLLYRNSQPCFPLDGADVDHGNDFKVDVLPNSINACSIHYGLCSIPPSDYLF